MKTKAFMTFIAIAFFGTTGFRMKDIKSCIFAEIYFRVIWKVLNF
jgi:hypothetical protein